MSSGYKRLVWAVVHYAAFAALDVEHAGEIACDNSDLTSVNLMQTHFRFAQQTSSDAGLYSRLSQSTATSSLPEAKANSPAAPVGKPKASEPSLSLALPSAQDAHRQFYDRQASATTAKAAETTGKAAETTGKAAETTAKAAETNDNTCLWAKDGHCDEPKYCEFGTDCSDCNTCEMKKISSRKPMTSQVCVDVEWTDSYGDTCGWYEEMPNCDLYGTMFPNRATNGQTYDATTACCGCGGGIVQDDVPTYSCSLFPHGCCPDGKTKRNPTGSNCEASLIQQATCGKSSFGCCHDGLTARVDQQGSNCQEIGPYHCGEATCKTCYYGDATCPNWHITTHGKYTPNYDGFMAYCKSQQAGKFRGGAGSCDRKCMFLGGCWKDYYGHSHEKSKRPMMQQLIQNGCKGEQRVMTGKATGVIYTIEGNDKVTFFYTDKDMRVGRIMNKGSRIEFGRFLLKSTLHRVPCDGD